MLQEAARQRLGALVRLDAALDEQHVEAGIAQGEDHQVNGEQDGGRLPSIVAHAPDSRFFVKMTKSSGAVSFAIPSHDACPLAQHS
ncbi:hypothetical protein GCM10020220_063930 [Nonomuraea rubra]